MAPMMNSLMGSITEHMNGLSVEAAPEPHQAHSPAKGRSSILKDTGLPQIAVLGSSSPQTDVSTIQWLFPQKFCYERTQESIVLTEKDNQLGLVLMIVDCQTSGQTVPIHWKNATFVLDEREIIIAAERCRGKAATVFVRETIEISKGVFTTLVVIRLSGGGNLVMMSQQFLQSQKGRKAFAEFVTSKGNIETLDRNRDSMPDSMQGENLLQALEDEFDHRSHRRKSYETGSLSDDDIQSLTGMPTRNFPTLGLSLQRKHGFMQQDVPINARLPISFETDLFAGQMSILIRPQHPEDDPYHYDQVFSQTKVRFVLQIQGKFKYIPQGTVFAGLEVVDDMKAALIMQGFCSLILRHVRKNHPNCHHSFGDEKGEKAHIVAPAWTFFDRLVATKHKSTPPPVGEPFNESHGSVSARRSSRSLGAWNTKDTYSFASYSECIDFPSWHLVDLSFVRNSDMHNFLGDSPIKIVMYEHRDMTVAPEKHLQVYNHYLFSLQMTHLGSIPEAEDALNQDEENVETPETLPWGKAKKSCRYDDDYGDHLSDNDWIHTQGSDRNDDESIECEVDDEDCVDDAMLDIGRQGLPSKALLEIVNDICPGWVEVITDEPGKYKKVYAFQVYKSTKVVFRTPTEFKSYLGIHGATQYVKSVSSPRLSASEEARRILGYAYSQALTKYTSKARQLATHKSPIDSQFLRRENPRREPGATNSKIQKAGFVARALSEFHWREEFVQLLEDHMAFFHPLRAKPSFRIYCSSVIGMKRTADDGEAARFAGYSFLQLETIGRTVYLMFSNSEERDSWADALESAVEANKNENQVGVSLTGIDDPTDQFLHKSSLWDCKQRRVLNCRRFSFGVPSSDLDPTGLVETALFAVNEAQESPQDASKLVAFLDAVAALKDVDVFTISDQERLAFFLNLFHLMVMHTYLLLGPPTSNFKYVAMSEMVSYQLSDDIFCLAELEHNIIRGGTSYPSQSKLIVPKSQYEFSVTSSDFRINFVLTFGAKNQPESVPIYKAPILDVQFEAAAMVALEKVSAEKQSRKVLLTLPRLLQWYSDDFGATTMDLLQAIDRYIDEGCRSILAEEVDGDDKMLTLKYLPVDFECRPVRLVSIKARGYNASFKAHEILI
mmetsp:Transcript_21010/g.34730  ORF Transcript_21010/g.34730 Transcript_21010/m.34730 type:complete len:1120 (+) Transcript_21010:118-3477(+)|eukprot:CAMPEP_0119004338 /NCGR_PEP_ID=MMETSP1176-20130426/1085_1 /TAXON_ID=265551 /ORGANISM="Synedropsis recta cf, Strain CCMP1620" /LENGTH=1119 /DNA_ID=CAMNT_0006956029 /DNA_START=46 /DNA_END=3405 /DNA_ORIENTATION=-